jgi:release factor H-coupled RctB family protein
MGIPISGERSSARAKISKFYNSATWIDGRAEKQLEQVAGRA